MALLASWASQAPRNAAVASKGLASQLGASSLHPASGGGRGPASSLSALGVFLSSADRYIGLGKEEAGALLIVARVRLAPDRLLDPFVTVLGALAVPWHADGGIPALDLSLGSTVGPDEVSCPPLAFPMTFTSHRSTRASASPADAVQALDNNGSDTLLALEGLQALRLIIIATDGMDNPGESSPWAPFYSASSQPALPTGDSPVFATRLPEEEAGNVSSLWVHFSAIPLPPDHGLPLGSVANPSAVTSARAFITELEAWSHLKDHHWDWMDNPFFAARFSAQARDPNSFVLDICSTKQIRTHWRQWVSDTTLQPDNHAVHFGTNNAMQHIKAALRHRVVRDNLLANATPSMAAKYRDFECRALQVFRGFDNPNPPLGTLPAALQPYLYCLAHPSAKTWMAKFEV